MSPEPPRHPTFCRWFQAVFLRAWVALAAALTLSLVLLKNGYPIPGVVLAVAFGLGGILLLGYLFHQLRHVACPDCGQPMKTFRNRLEARYEARCPCCGKAWDIGIGD